MNEQIINEIKNYVDGGIKRRRQGKRLATTEIKKVRNTLTFTTQFLDSDFEDWYDVKIVVSSNKSGVKIQVGDSSSYCTFNKVSHALSEINAHLSWRNLKN